MSLAHKLSKFAPCYDEAHNKIWARRAGISMDCRKDYRRLLNSSLDALLFFTMYVHERGGRNPRFSAYHRVALRKALGKNCDDSTFEMKVLSDPNFPTDVWGSFVTLTNNKPNESHTKGPVKYVLEWLRAEHEPNIVRFLLQKPLKDANSWLDDMPGIGPKIAALFLRDLLYVGEWSDISENLHLVQPVDRWVARCANECWEEENWMDLDKLNNEKVHMDYARKIVEHCRMETINSINFNKGAWFVGSHFDELCIFFGIPEEEQFPVMKCVEKIDPIRVTNGIRAFADREREIFPP